MDSQAPVAASEQRPTPFRETMANTNASSPSSGPQRTIKPKEKTIQRASLACVRCRRHKLRCLGGDPCERCVRARSECSFRSRESDGRTTKGANPSSGSVSSGRNSINSATAPVPYIPPRRTPGDERSRQLESNVASLVAGLGENLNGSTDSQQYVHFNVGTGIISPTPALNLPTQPLVQRLPPPMHTRPIDPPRIGVSLQSTVSPSSTIRRHGQSSTSPDSINLVNGTPVAGPSNLLVPGVTQALDADKDGVQFAATESLYEAPFRSLMRQSRRNSPERDPPPKVSRFGYNTSVFNEQDDPINTDIVTESMAENLFRFFVDHCHPFLPIINVSQDSAFATIRQSAPLFSAITGVASRFYIDYRQRRALTSLPVLESTAPSRLANLAEAHLGHTLLRRHFALSDVQAILLLAAWSLPSGGGSGPDAWVVTGHAARVSRRLGVHKVLAQASETARATEQGSEEWHKLHAFVPQWRTWLSWFTFDGFLSLGFGRPQSTQFETVDESGFLQMRLHQVLPRPGSPDSVSLYGDVYIAGQVQLTQIGRDLINWSEMLADAQKAIYADPRRASIFRDRDLSMKNMFKELNTRLEEWSRLWIWTGSPYALYLGPSARVAKLQADHLRLCLNSYALKAGADIDDEIATYLRTALTAATSTIQVHYESSQTDLGLSFATDYLTIALAQAAVFLIRITKAPPAVQNAVDMKNAVLAHYLKMSIELLEAADMSETLLGTYLAKTIKEIGRAAKTIAAEESFMLPDQNSQLTDYFSSATVPNPTNGEGDYFNFEDFFQVQNELELKYLLGLPSDGEGLTQDASALSSFNFTGLTADNSAGLGNLGLGTNNANRWNGSLNLEALGSLLGTPATNTHQ